MWITRRCAWMLLFGFFLVSPLSAAAESITEGAMLSITCAGCHGPGGRSPGAIPSIAGKSADYIEQAMLDFKAEKRPSTVMSRHAKGYTDAEIKLIAEYFAGSEIEGVTK